jgi:hypothetical protein
MKVWERCAFSLVLLAVLVLAGCGGGSGSTEDSAPGTAASTASTTSESEPSTAEPSGAEPSAEFVGKGENGTLAKIGKEADATEREAASEVVEESLEARAEADWKVQCETLAAFLIKQLEKAAVILGASGSCAEALETESAPTPPPVLASTMTEPIAALRVKGTRGFAFYHGAKGKDYVMPMAKEGGEWKVASLQEQETP